MIYDGIDTAARITAAQARKLKQEGISFVGRYIAPLSCWKAITAQEIECLHDNGLAILLCFEINADDVKGGAVKGSLHGAQAKELADALGVPAGTVIYFAADYEAVANEFPTIEAYIRSAQDACYPYVAGIYGHASLVDYLASKGACKHFWQCCAWSYGRVSAHTSVYQYAWSGADESKTMQDKVGFAVDMDRTELMEAAGLWLPPVPEYEKPEEPKKPWYADDMEWIEENHIMNDGRPQDNVTRAELAAVMYRFYNKFIKE